jgi:hypothetical protein
LQTLLLFEVFLAVAKIGLLVPLLAPSLLLSLYLSAQLTFKV